MNTKKNQRKKDKEEVRNILNENKRNKKIYNITKTEIKQLRKKIRKS